MITVKTKLQRTSNKIEDFSAITFNALAEQVAKETEKQVKGFTCENHPTRNSTLLVVSDKKSIKLDKSGFCCKEFADRVNLE